MNYPGATQAHSREEFVQVNEPEPAHATLPLAHHVQAAVEKYFADLDGHEPSELYQMVLQEVERPLLKEVMHQVRGNQSKAAKILGITRSTLRKKLQRYQLHGS